MKISEKVQLEDSQLQIRLEHRGKSNSPTNNGPSPTGEKR